jgi:hypothetical protein
LVGDGLAVFDEFVVVVVEVEFDMCVPEFEFIVEEFDVLDEFEVGTVVVVEDEFVTVVDVAFEFIALVFERFAFVLFAVSPPQAAPRAARPNSAESAIAFFILKTISCLSQRLILDLPPSGSFAPKLFLFLEQTK